MDENKKNEVIDENENLEETVETPEDRAKKILEDLNKAEENAVPEAVRDWDGVLPEAEDDFTEIIGEPQTHIIEEAPEEDEEIPEEELCVICGKRRRCTTISEDYEYCAQCRIRMLKTPLKPIGIVTIVILIIVSLFSSFVFAQDLLIGLSAGVGVALEAKNCDEVAIAAYQDTLEVVGQTTGAIPVKVVERLALLYAESYGPARAESEIISAYLSTYDAKESKVLSELLKESEKYNLAMEACYEVMQTYSDPETGKMDEEAIDILKGYLDEGKYEKDFVQFTIASVYTSLGNTEKAIEYLEEIRTASPEKYWIYNAGNALVDAYIKIEDNESALAVADTILNCNASHQQANWLKARLYLVDGKIEEAKAVSEELKKNDSSNATAIAIDALILRLEGKYQEAIDLCTESIDSDIYNCEIYYQNLVAMVLNGDEESASGMVSEYYNYTYSYGTTDDFYKCWYAYLLTMYLTGDENYKIQKEGMGENFPKELEAFEKGDKTLEEIFLKGDYELR